MCGIIGIFGTEAISQRDRDAVKQGAEVMALRGPDGEGFQEGPGYYFGHRRLAILDPESGQQPWVDADTGVTLTYNGEIYNFREIQQELKQRGHRFTTACDTEVLVRAYVEWGRRCLHRLNGMFAFALVDPREDALWLVRDRLGVKPLYYHEQKSQLRFASSMTALFAFPEIKRVIDRAALWHYFRTIRTSLGSRSLIQEVSVLEPGQELWWKRTNGDPVIENYWSLPMRESDDKSPIEFAEAAEETSRRVDAAVQHQLISDVPLGGFLSGGLDSSVMTSSAIAGGARDFGSYSVGYDEDGFNEWSYVRKAVEYYDVFTEEIHLSGDHYLDDWDWLVGEKGLPLSTPNEVPIWHLAKSFRNRFTAALTGEGADEAFGGYVGPTFCAVDFDRAHGQLGPIEEAALVRQYGASRFSSRRDHFFRVNSWLPKSTLSQVLESRWIPEISNDPVDEYYERLLTGLDKCSTLDAYMRVHLRVNLEGLLNRLDSGTMAASVEGRVPFTDHTLVEWMFGLPDTYKMSLTEGTAWEQVRAKNSFELSREGLVETKRLLRAGFRDRVCESILTRKKMSFPVPFNRWFQTILAEPYRAQLAESEIISQLLPSQTRAALQASEAVDPMLAWPLMNLALWQKKMGVSL